MGFLDLLRAKFLIDRGSNLNKIQVGIGWVEMVGVGNIATIGMAKSERVAQALEREIRIGSVVLGDQLDSEAALMQRFEVSRNTIRRGLQILAGRGLITTRTGIGSFVTYQGATIDDQQGWSVALSQGPDRLNTRLLSLRRGGCGLSDRFFLGRGMAACDDYLCIDRLRIDLDTGQGVSLERSRLPWRDSLSPILVDGLVEDSLSKTLAAKGLSAASGEEIAGVLADLGVQDAELMHRPAGGAMLRLQRLTKAADDSVLEHVVSILDPNRFGLRMIF